MLPERTSGYCDGVDSRLRHRVAMRSQDLVDKSKTQRGWIWKELGPVWEQVMHLGTGPGARPEVGVRFGAAAGSQKESNLQEQKWQNTEEEVGMSLPHAM